MHKTHWFRLLLGFVEAIPREANANSERSRPSTNLQQTGNDIMSNDFRGLAQQLKGIRSDGVTPATSNYSEKPGSWTLTIYYVIVTRIIDCIQRCGILFQPVVVPPLPRCSISQRQEQFGITRLSQ